jgi:uncharacterized membrane protein YdjX (TVP38/TMEM64 family)
VRDSGDRRRTTRAARIGLLAAVIVVIAVFLLFDLERFFTLAAVKSELAAIIAFREAHPVVLALAFFALYVAIVALALPIDLVFTLLSGALFGVVAGAVLASFASSAGATLALLATRFLFRDAVRRKFGNSLAAIDRGMQREGALYLFALRVVPAFPFMLVNLAMGLTALPTRTFYWVTQVAMLPGTIVYVNAGTQLAAVKSLSDVLEPHLLGSLALLGVLPLLGKKLIDWLRSRRG